jgi:putative FmdB family regulatory protein
MPAYDYRCQDCGTAFEVRMSISAYSNGEHPPCSNCGSTEVARTFGAVNVLTGGRSGSSLGPSCGPGAFT